MRISDWSSDVCSSDLISDVPGPVHMALGRLARARLTNVNIIARRRSRMMKLHEFTLIASGLDPEAEDFEDRFETGCDDATLSFQKGVIILEFSREAVSFSKAVASAWTSAAPAP